MKQYLELMEDILVNGHEKEDRTGTGTLSVFGRQMRFDLSKGFPLVTTKRCHLRSIIHELLWFLKGETNIKYLTDNKVTIWDEWAAPADVLDRSAMLKQIVDTTMFRDNIDAFVESCRTHSGIDLKACTDDAFCEFIVSYWTDYVRERYGHPQNINVRLEDHIQYLKRAGDLGPVYGKQWRNWEGKDGKFYDQIAGVINMLKKDPDSRRIIVSAWNVGELDEMALMPCHAFFQFYTHQLPSGKRVLSCQLYQRSVDTVLGLPFNIASYALLTHMLAYILNFEVGDFVWTGGDVHLYKNHLTQACEQLSREPRSLPTLKILTDRKINDPAEFKFEDFEMEGYDPCPAIKAPIAV